MVKLCCFILIVIALTFDSALAADIHNVGRRLRGSQITTTTTTTVVNTVSRPGLHETIDEEEDDDMMEILVDDDVDVEEVITKDGLRNGNHNNNNNNNNNNNKQMGNKGIFQSSIDTDNGKHILVEFMKWKKSFDHQHQFNNNNNNQLGLGLGQDQTNNLIVNPHISFGNFLPKLIASVGGSQTK
jgi:hypothetical protein